MIELFDLMRTVWRHRVVAIVTLAVVMAATTAYVFLQTPVYESTEALQLSSADPSFLAEVDTLTPLYSELLSAQYTLTIAQAELGAKPLAGSRCAPSRVPRSSRWTPAAAPQVLLRSPRRRSSAR